MSLLQTAAPILTGANKLTIELVPHAQSGGIALIVSAHLPERDTSSTDPVVAALVAALARPIYLVAPNAGEAETVLCNALQAASAARAEVADQLDAYRAALAEGANQARAAEQAAKEAKSKTKTGAKSNAKASATASAATPETASAGPEPKDASTEAPAEPADSSTRASQPAPAASLFDDI